MRQASAMILVPLPRPSSLTNGVIAMMLSDDVGVVVVVVVEFVVKM